MRPALASLLATTAVAYNPFVIPYMTTHQPNGNPDGQVNYYNIGFNVTSINGDTTQQAYCWKFWGDNSNDWDSTSVSYSTSVPAGQWLPCAVSSSDLGNYSTEFEFQLFPYFSIGNFSIQVKQNFTQTEDGESSQIIAQSDPFHVTNGTSNYTCQIDPTYVQYEEHAHGDCVTPDGFSGFSLPVTSSSPACAHASKVSLSFPVTETTVWGDEVYVIGNITELGNWDVNRAVLLDASQYTASNTLWTGGNVSVAAGEYFAYKYLQRNKDGSLLWECGENRVQQVGSFTCGTEVAGNNPDYFRCGNH